MKFTRRTLAPLAAVATLAAVTGSAHAGQTSAIASVFCKNAPSLYFKWMHCGGLKAPTTSPTAQIDPAAVQNVQAADTNQLKAKRRTNN